MSDVKILNEYGRLKTVILGNGEKLYFPGMHDIELEAESSWWKKLLNHTIYSLLAGRRVPKFIEKKYQKELKDFERVLQENGVNVLQLSEVVPQKNEAPGLGQMYARDSVMCAGDKMIAGNLQIDMRKKELRGYREILAQYEARKSVLHVDPAAGIYLEGGDVMVDAPYIYVGIGKYASNEAGAKWLQEQVGAKFQVIPVHLTNEGILHLDCCMTIIGEKTGIIHRDSLEKPLPKPLDTYDFIDIDSKVRHEMGGNVLVIGDKKIVIQKRHKNLQKELVQRGFEVYPVDFTWHARLDGAFRCATCPVVRD